MNMPFCDKCTLSATCEKDTALFEVATGNKRVPPESYCREQYAKAGEELGDFYRNVLVDSVENPTCLYPIFPELKEQVDQLAGEWKAQHTPPDATKAEEVVPKPHFTTQMPLSVTLMLTEKCNLACEYCYERFSGNLKPQSMSHETIDQTLALYFTKERLALNPQLSVDLIGGEVFVELELLDYAVKSIVAHAGRAGICPRRVGISLCTNGTNFQRQEVREWCEETKKRIGTLDVCISIDGIKECHDLCRNNSFDRIMEQYPWWRETFPNSTIKGTISPQTLKYLSRNVLFYVEELGLDKFYINPTFEGPWTDADAELYGNELIACAAYFLAHPAYNVMENSNLFMRVDMPFAPGPRKQNWCGSGVHMRAIGVDGTIYPCLRAATSGLHAIGSLQTGVDRNKLIPSYLYTSYNDNAECAACDIAPYCPSCVMQWVEDTGDMFMRSQKLCTMTRVRYQVSKWYWDHAKADLESLKEERHDNNVD